MKQGCRDRTVGLMCHQAGRTAQTASFFLAAWFLLFGAVVAALVPGSLEERISHLWFLGAIPALGLFVTGYILRRTLEFSSKLCPLLVARGLQRLAPGAIRFSSKARAAVSDVLDEWLMILARGRSAASQWAQWSFRVAQKTCRFVDRQFWHVHRIIVAVSCLLIRTTARFLIKTQRFLNLVTES
jgi:hypothetical protein